MRNLILVLVLVGFQVTGYGQTEHRVKPSDTDINITTPDVNHYVYINDTIQKENKLFLFLPGTSGLPFHYRKLLKSIANIGYHSIGLNYPNNKAINTVCALSLDTTCHSRARLEIFDGEDRHSNIDVDTFDCIQNRVIKLLQHLDNEFPTEDWGQYYLNDSITWDKIVLSGHSQGGGHAGIIAKNNKVSRVAMFASYDWMPLLSRNPDWIFWDSQTPADRYYGFAHEEDEILDFAKIETTWTNLDLFNFGNMIMVDTTTQPYFETRTLSTQIIPATNTSKYHNSVAVDLYTPGQNGVPILEPVWHYLISYQDSCEFISNNGEWDEPSNWNFDRVPDCQDHVVIQDTVNVNISMGDTGKCKSIQVKIGGTLNCQMGAVLEVGAPD